MLRFKLFSGPIADLEPAVNAWLTEFEPDVTQMSQTVHIEGSVTITFLFEESFRGQEIRMTSERGRVSTVSPALPPDVLRDDPIELRPEPPESPRPTRT